MTLTASVIRRVANLTGRGARGPVGINTPVVPTPGQFLVKAPGGNRDYAGATGAATPLNAVALTDLAAGTGSSLVGWLRGTTGAVVRSLYAKLNDMPFRPEDFGAVGDGATDCTAAFAALGAAVNAAGGGVIELKPNAVYRMGQQALAGATGHGYSYSFAGGLALTGLSGLTILGHGATLKWLDGLHYGSFDPTTGAVVAAGGTNADYAASLASLLSITSSSNLSIENLTLDGNLANLVIGGTWNPPGTQLAGRGLDLRGVSRVNVRNVTAKANPLDGIYITGNGLTQFAERDEIVLTACKAIGNGRQGASLVGGSGITAINCSFTGTGQTVNTGTGASFSSAPAAGVDIEANGSNWTTHVAFQNCSFVNNVGVGLLSSQGNCEDVLVQQGTFWQGFAAASGVTAGSGDALWITKPTKLTIEDCTLHGAITNLATTARMSRCTMDDAVHPTYGQAAATRNYLLDSAGGTFFDCDFTVTASDGPRIVYGADSMAFVQCRQNYRGGGLGTGTASSFMGGGVLKDCEFSEALTDASPANHYIYVGGTTHLLLRDRVFVAGPYIHWGSTSGQLGQLAGLSPYTAPGSSIGAAPAAVGLYAVVAGVAYMATGTSGAGDWKQITN